MTSQEQRKQWAAEWNAKLETLQRAGFNTDTPVWDLPDNLRHIRGSMDSLSLRIEDSFALES